MLLTRRNFLRAVGIVALAGDAFAAGEVKPSAVQADAPAPYVAITWVGAATMVIRFEDLTILTDPALGETFAMGDPNDADHQTIRTHRRLTPVSGLDLKTVDLVLLSHAHPDHFDQRAAADLNRSLPIILPAGDEKAIAGKGFEALDTMEWGETRQVDAGAGRVTITAVAARHSRDPATARVLGLGNGYWITFSRGDWTRTLYWTGDTMPTADVVEAVRSLGRPDIMVPHVGGVGVNGPLGQISMGADDVVALAAAVHPAYVLPVHHSTYAFFREPISRLAERSKGQPYRLDPIDACETVAYD
ncbi:MBL fold metallo-hydrolase [Rhodospirillaceae bacterium SYSU D60014]|uniref:MBL fold metallo-hydrolase n=1 Tax=Virgifigura deserti TaxID=2268457 RepID=UPI000E6646D5